MTNSKLSVVDKIKTTKAEDPIFTLQDFPAPFNHPTTMSIDKFIAIPAFPVQRNHEQRASKLEPLLAKPMFGHNEVDVIVYRGETTLSPAPFKKDQEYVLNGHTRQHVWKSRMSGNMLSKTKHVPIPNTVVVNYYVFTDPQAAIDFYYSRDSLIAVEKKPDMVTGALRANNILANLQTSRIKKGLISTALDVACPWKPRAQFKVDSVESLIEQVGKMKESIVEMDKLSAPGQGAISTQYALGVAMLSGVAMEHDSRWITAINRLIENEPSDINDGIDWLIKASNSNPTGDPSLDNALPYNTGLFNDRGGLLDYVSFCWKSYIDNKKIDSGPARKDIINKYSDLLRSTWNQDSEEE